MLLEKRLILKDEPQNQYCLQTSNLISHSKKRTTTNTFGFLEIMTKLIVLLSFVF